MTNYKNWSKSRRGFILLIALIFALVGMSQVNANPDVPFDVTITGPDTIAADTPTQYTLTYTGVVSTGGVRYTVPSGFTVNSLSVAPTSQNGLTYTWVAGVLAGSGNGSITITGQYASDSCTSGDSVHSGITYDTHRTTSSDTHTTTVEGCSTTPTPTATPIVTATPEPPTALSQSSFDNVTPTTTPFWLALLLLSAVTGLVFYRVRVSK